MPVMPHALFAYLQRPGDHTGGANHKTHEVWKGASQVPQNIVALPVLPHNLEAEVQA
jgi:hypothetical protein